MFDQLLRDPPPRPNLHPAHVTMFVRRLVLAKMTLIVGIYLRQGHMPQSYSKPTDIGIAFLFQTLGVQAFTTV
jgi:hypothetical protein